MLAVILPWAADTLANGFAQQIQDAVGRGCTSTRAPANSSSRTRCRHASRTSSRTASSTSSGIGRRLSEVNVVAQLARGDGPRPPARRPDRPGHPRRAQAAADVQAPRRPDHRLEPDHRRLRGHRRAEAVDRGRPLEHHRLRDDRLRRPAARPPPSVAPGRAVPALPARHAPGVHRRPDDRARRVRLPAQRAARPEVAALPCRLSRRSWRRTRRSPATRSTPSRLTSTRASPAPTTASILDRVANTAFRPHKRLLDHVARRHPQRAGLHAARRTAGRLQRDHGFGPRRRPEPAEGRVHRRGRAGHREVGHRRQPRRGAVGPRHPDPPRHGLQGVHREPAQDRRDARRRDVQVLPRHRERRRAARRRDPRRGPPDPHDQHQPLHAREGAHGQGADRRHPRRQPRVGLLHRRPAGRAPGRGRQHRPDPRDCRQARRSRSASSSSRRSSARTAPTRSSSGSTTRSSSTGRRRSSGRPTTSSTSASSARSRSSTD